MDLICAISTPPGVGGIAVIRLSGDGAKELAESYLYSVKFKDKSEKLQNRHAAFCQLRDGDELIDEVVATWFQAPNSYTGEDVVEISCHGSLYVQQRILQLFIGTRLSPQQQVAVSYNARLAEPGEFTQRAFLNGRLDLSQAEAVADLIDSRSQSAHRLAISQMRGGYAHELEHLRQQFIDTTALLELELDFSDEDLEFVSRDRVQRMVVDLRSRIERLLNSFQAGNAIKNGIPVAIVGRPNAGKSSLLNALLSEERAIVSDIPGTTRDTIEETMTIEGITFRFIDTAGLRHSNDPIEDLGFGRAIKAAQQASIILFVRNITVPFDNYAFDDIAFITNQCDMKNKHLFIVHNKCDLPHETNPQGHIVSAKEAIGIDELKKSIAMTALKDAGQNDGVLLTNMRHYEALMKVMYALDEVTRGLQANLTPDLLVIDLRDALYHLGTITGKVSSDEVLSSIFSRFCVGK